MTLRRLGQCNILFIDGKGSNIDNIPFAFQVAFGCQGDRPMSVYPMNFELRQGGNQANPRSVQVVHDRG
ncbi:hypothetical protein [Candidatus Regiella endosymbiont of Tuberolachnus salignus]|uniref:hypothetical protein n=1 Tax=Candidatus Regiella endosymbiont of Tuberolachnus salignus TaxID=3077956 RepID=UPI0030D2BA5F